MAHEGSLARETDEADAFTALVAAYHTDVLRLAGAITGDYDLADDVAQATWTAAWQHRHELRDPDRVRAWLLTITANQGRSALRRRRLRPWLPFSPVEPTASATNADEHLDLVAALQRLPLRDRQIVALRYGMGETSAEIGQQVGLSDSAVRVRLTRLQARLREEMRDD